MRIKFWVRVNEPNPLDTEIGAELKESCDLRTWASGQEASIAEVVGMMLDELADEVDMWTGVEFELRYRLDEFGWELNSKL